MYPLFTSSLFVSMERVQTDGGGLVCLTGDIRRTNTGEKMERENGLILK